MVIVLRPGWNVARARLHKRAPFDPAATLGLKDKQIQNFHSDEARLVDPNLITWRASPAYFLDDALAYLWLRRDQKNIISEAAVELNASAAAVRSRLEETLLCEHEVLGIAN